MKKLILVLLLLTKLTALQAQIHVNKEWANTSGNPLGLEWSNSITNANNQLITVGNSLIVGQGANILLTKYNNDGTTAWQSNFNTMGSNNDYGISLIEDINGNLFVVGTTDNSTATNYDVVIIKYNTLGTLLWSQTYNTTFNKMDIGTDIKLDATGNIYICASSEGNTTSMDYLLLKYNTTGTLTWASRYDYASLIEIPIGLDIDAGGNIIIAGASASSATNWDYTIAKFNAAGTYLGDARTPTLGNGFDQPLDFAKDAFGNFIITGKVSTNGINYDVKTIKLSNTFSVLWSNEIDIAGFDDQGSSIDVDAIGNVYVGGFGTKNNTNTKAILVKYNANGTELWRYEQNAINPTGNASIKAIDVLSNGEVYLIIQEKGKSGSEDIIISKIDEYGELVWERKVNSALDENPTNINISNDGGIYVSALKNGANKTYETIKYRDWKQSDNIVVDNNGKPLFNANQLIVRFNQSALDVDAIDNNVGQKNIEFAGIDYWLNPTTLSIFNDALSNLCASNINSFGDNPCGIKAIKVFTELKTTLTTTTSTLGEIIPLPDFWTTLLLEFPNTMNIQQVANALATIPSVVRYSEPNNIALLNQGSNDAHYDSLQHSLHKIPGSNYNNVDINVEEAWDVYPTAGLKHIRCGVFDTGLWWSNDDFGYDGADPNSSKVIDGWHFGINQPLKAFINADSNGHGTRCAGIIGAIRNNNIGVSGIAGGNGGTNNDDRGVDLYGLRLFTKSQFFYTADLQYIVNAIVNAPLKPDSNSNYAFEIDVETHSWGYRPTQLNVFTPANNQIIKEAIRFVARKGVPLITSRANEANDDDSYPATIDDDWSITVGATGRDGNFVHDTFKTYFPYPANGEYTASFGKGVDVAAPGSDSLIFTTSIFNSYWYFNGTSAAAPHVTGVVCLLLSYFNDSVYNYKNLSPEDCEKIIELAATDDAINPGYDPYIGWGKLNAGKAMRLVEKPFNDVKHFGTDSQFSYNRTYSQVSTAQTINLLEGYTNSIGTFYQSGAYKVNKYKVDATVFHNLIADDSVVSYWPRPSSSLVLEDINGSNLLPRERVKINSLDNSSCNMTGYVYQVFDTLNNSIGWWPFNVTTQLSKASFEYSILTHNSKVSAMDIFEVSKNKITIQPNPSNHSHTLSIKCNNSAPLVIRLLNINGQFIKTVFSGKTKIGFNNFIENISNLNSGVYLYEILMEGKTENIKFIKQ
jgi:Subtilase family